MRRLFPVAGFVLSVCGAASPLRAQALVPTEKLPTQTVCMDCHGPIGDSVKDTVPRLNGQTVEYLRRRLDDFRSPGSQDPHATDAMWETVINADDRMLSEVADYYARQPPTPAKTGRPLAEAGYRLYLAGDLANQISGCAGCHGASGEGGGQVPRLAGQHGVYLKNQLERMRLNLRVSGAMHPKTNSMTDKQIEELVAYLAGE